MKKIKKDWPSHKIIYELKETGTSLAEIGIDLGLRPRSIYDVLRRPRPILEITVAKRLGIHPRTIWPSRYDDSGKPVCQCREGRLPITKRVSDAVRTLNNA
jgi:Ner family transcriptional regulator